MAQLLEILLSGSLSTACLNLISIEIGRGIGIGNWIGVAYDSNLYATVLALLFYLVLLFVWCPNPLERDVITRYLKMLSIPCYVNHYQVSLILY